MYLDDIIIWSNNLNEHINNVDLILSALRKAGVFINAKKSVLFTTDVEFLGHKISQAGIEACEQKAGKIIDWPIPTSSTETRQFLGLVRYLQIFLPDLATHCKVLEELTQKRYEREFPEWTQNRQNAFDAIKQLVVSRECLTVIDPDLMPEYKIFVTTDASDIASGAVLSFGKTWETARPVAYDSCSFKGAELNYPVHEKEMLAVVCALKKWKYELLGAPFFVYTDHKTLLNFHTQRDLSRRQARWMELLSIYDCKFVYVKGEANSVADALSRLPSLTCPSSNDADIVASHPYNIADPQNPVVCINNDRNQFSMVAALTIRIPPVATRSVISIDDNLVLKIRESYASDVWCQKLLSASRGMPQLMVRNGLWYLNDRLIIPNGCGVRVPIPDDRCQSIALDFIGPLPNDNGYDCILTITDRLNSEFRLIPTRTDITAKELALIFFDKWYCENGLPLELISDRDKLFC